MKQTKTTKIALLSILTALSVVLGYIVKIPTQTGILTLLDAGIFFTSFYYGRREGAVVGGLGGFIIDLISGSPHWMFFSLLFHGLQGYFAGFKGKWQGLGLVMATIIMVAGYACATAWMKGWGQALLDVPHNLLQNFVGMVVGYLIHQSIKKIRKQ